MAMGADAGREMKVPQKLKYHRTTKHLHTTSFMPLSLSMGTLNLTVLSIMCTYIMPNCKK